MSSSVSGMMICEAALGLVELVDLARPLEVRVVRAACTVAARDLALWRLGDGAREVAAAHAELHRRVAPPSSR